VNIFSTFFLIPESHREPTKTRTRRILKFINDLKKNLLLKVTTIMKKQRKKEENVPKSPLISRLLKQNNTSPLNVNFMKAPD
jgi:hypothetical protein